MFLLQGGYALGMRTLLVVLLIGCGVENEVSTTHEARSYAPPPAVVYKDAGITPDEACIRNCPAGAECTVDVEGVCLIRR